MQYKGIKKNILLRSCMLFGLTILSVSLAGCGKNETSVLPVSSETQAVSVQSGLEPYESTSTSSVSKPDDYPNIEEGKDHPLTLDLLDATQSYTQEEMQSVFDSCKPTAAAFMKSIFDFHEPVDETTYTNTIKGYYTTAEDPTGLNITSNGCENNFYAYFSGVHMNSSYVDNTMQSIFFVAKEPDTELSIGGYVTADFSNDRLPSGRYVTPYGMVLQKVNNNWKVREVDFDATYQADGFYEYYKEGTKKNIISYAGTKVLDWYRFCDVQQFLSDSDQTTQPEGTTITTKDGKTYSWSSTPDKDPDKIKQ